MNKSIIFVFSIGINLFFYSYIIYKAHLPPKQKIIETSYQYQQVSEAIDQVTRIEKNRVYKPLRRMPILKKDVLGAIDDIQDKTKHIVSHLERYYGKMSKYEYRKEFYDFIEHEQLVDSIKISVKQYEKDIQRTYQDMIESITYTLERVNSKIKYQPKLDFKPQSLDLNKRLKQLHAIDVLEIYPILLSIQLELRLLEYHYIKTIVGDVPQHEIKHRLGVTYNTNSTAYELGKNMDIELGVFGFYTDIHPNSYLKINGKKYSFDDKGFVEYRKKCTQKGAQIIHMEASLYNPLTDEEYTRKSSIEFLVE